MSLEYRFTNIASLGIIAVTFLERVIGFWAAYLLPTAVLAVPIIVLLFYMKGLGETRLPSSIYIAFADVISIVIFPPEGNELVNVLKIMMCAARSGFRLNNASTASQAQKGGKVPWSDQLVDDVKRAMTACRIL